MTNTLPEHLSRIIHKAVMADESLNTFLGSLEVKWVNKIHHSLFPRRDLFVATARTVCRDGVIEKLPETTFWM